jgi:hypothetical protein
VKEWRLPPTPPAELFIYCFFYVWKAIPCCLLFRNTF